MTQGFYTLVVAALVWIIEFLPTGIEKRFLEPGGLPGLRNQKCIRPSNKAWWVHWLWALPGFDPWISLSSPWDRSTTESQKNFWRSSTYWFAIPVTKLRSMPSLLLSPHWTSENIRAPVNLISPSEGSSNPFNVRHHRHPSSQGSRVKSAVDKVRWHSLLGQQMIPKKFRSYFWVMGNAGKAKEGLECPSYFLAPIPITQQSQGFRNTVWCSNLACTEEKQEFWPTFMK